MAQRLAIFLTTFSWLIGNEYAKAFQSPTSGGVSLPFGWPKSKYSNSKNGLVEDTTKLGNLQVPSVGIGTISWSSESPLYLRNDELQSLVNTAYESNAAFFDTAERYGSHYKTALGLGWGETESLTRQMIRRAQAQQAAPPAKNKAIVATKFTPSPWRTTAQSVVDACEQSRLRLGVDQIDLWQLHMPDIVQPLRWFGQDAPKDEIYWDGLAACYHAGLVKNVGVSNYGPTLLRRCQEALAKRGVPLASNQIAYSLLGRGNGGQATVDACQELGIAVLAYFPFAMGLLTGKYSEDETLANNSHAMMKESHNDILSLSNNKKTRLEKQDLLRYARGDGAHVPAGGMAPLLAVMQEMATRRNKTVAQVALNYIMCKGAIPIPGARTVAQVSDNLGAMGWRLTRPEVARLEAAADGLGFGFEGAGFKRTSEKFVGYGVEKWSLD